MGLPGQPPTTGVTAILATSWSDTIAALNIILPVPLAASPTVGLSLVQENNDPNVPENTEVTGAPAQTVILVGWLTVGNGFTVMVKF